ncbi:MAG: hypothetical protein F9K30_23895, partial [Dechloromonas sp.]
MFFQLAFGLLISLRSLAFEPLAVEIPLPGTARGKPVWVAEILDSGHLAVGFEGGIAIGTPFDKWSIIPTPNGQVPRCISEAHGKILVAGHGFAAFWDHRGLQPIKNLETEIVCAKATATGWLISGSGGVWTVEADGSVQQVLIASSEAKGPYRICTIDQETVVSALGTTPLVWQDGRLSPASRLKAFSRQEIVDSAGDVLLTSQGIRNLQNETVVPAAVGRMLLKHGAISVIESGPWIIVPTYSKGLDAIDRSAGTLAWTTQQLGSTYFTYRQRNSFLVGSSRGFFSVHDPFEVQFRDIEGKSVIGLVEGEQQGAKLVTASGVCQLEGELSWDTSVQWPTDTGAEVRDGRLINDKHHVALLTRYVSGLAVVGDTAAVAQDQGLTLLDRDGASRFTAIPAIAGSLATDGRRFLVGTATQGVQVVETDGTIAGQLGAGRATARTVRPGKAVLLFWDGAILDSDASTLGHITWGNPRDAAFVQDRLAILVTRPDRDPVVGLLEGDAWVPLEIP